MSKNSSTFAPHLAHKEKMATLIYKVEVEEILRRLVEIEAQSPEEAEDKVVRLYRDCEIVLGAEDFIGEPTIRCIEAN